MEVLLVQNQDSTDPEITIKNFSFKKMIDQIQAMRFGQSLAAFILTVKGKILAKFPIPILIILPVIFSLGTLFLFPTTLLEDAFAQSECWLIILAFYVGTSLSLSTRQIYRSGFLHAIQRKITDMRFTLQGPFISLAIDDRDTWMGGHRARLQIAVMGLLSTFFLAFLAVTLFYFQLIPLDITLTMVGSSVLAAGISSFPFFRGDGEELLHLIMFGHKLECTLAKDCRTFLQKFYDLSLFHRRILWATVATTVWVIVWSNLWSNSYKIILPRIATDIGPAATLFQSIFGYFALSVLATALAFPILFLLGQIIWGILLRRGAAGETMDKNEEIGWEEKRRRLSRVPLFAAFTEEARIHLLGEMEQHFYKAGDRLVKQGEHGDQLFVMLNGEADAIFRDATGKLHIVGTLKDGDTFGEVALIDEVPRTASVVARKDCNALALSKEDFEKHIADDKTQSNRVKQMIRLSSFFKRHPLFSRMNAIDQAKIIERLRFDTVVMNEELNDSEAEEPRFFLVYTGKLVADDKEEDFILSSEDCFGFLAPGQDPAYLPSVKAFEGSGLLSLSQSEFKELIWGRISDSMEIV